MLQYELTGVWFVLTVINIYVELISLENRSDGPVRFVRTVLWVHFTVFNLQKAFSDHMADESHPGDEAVTDILWQLLIVHQLLQENTGNTQTANAHSVHLPQNVAGRQKV